MATGGNVIIDNFLQRNKGCEKTEVTWGVTMAVFRDSYLVLEGLGFTLRTACKPGHWYPCFLSHSYWMASRATPLVLTDTFHPYSGGVMVVGESLFYGLGN